MFKFVGKRKLGYNDKKHVYDIKTLLQFCKSIYGNKNIIVKLKNSMTDNPLVIQSIEPIAVISRKKQKQFEIHVQLKEVKIDKRKKCNHE